MMWTYLGSFLVEGTGVFIIYIRSSPRPFGCRCVLRTAANAKSPEPKSMRLAGSGTEVAENADSPNTDVI